MTPPHLPKPRRSRIERLGKTVAVLGLTAAALGLIALIAALIIR